MTNSIFGHDDFAYGPGNIYWDTISGGENRALGDTDQIEVLAEMTKIDLKASQQGDRAADRAVSSQIYTITAGLAKATVEILEDISQGLVIEKDTGGTPIRIWLSDITAQRDSSIWKQLTFKEIIDGIESTDPFGIFDFWRACPSVDSNSMVFDAVTQRYYGIAFITYKVNAAGYLDPNGRPTYGASREVV